MAGLPLTARLRALLDRFFELAWSRATYRFVIEDWQSLSDLEAASQVINTLRFSRNLSPLQMDAPRGKRICVLAPHIDDEAIGPGGTLLKAARAGAKIDVVYFTRGRSKESGEHRDTRMAEAQAALKMIGARHHYLGHMTREISITEKNAEALAEMLRELKPDTLFLPFLFDDHDDHRRVSDMLLMANEVASYEPKLEVWAYQVYTAVLGNVVIDITEAAQDKRAMIQCYASEMAKRDWAHYALGLNAWNLRFLKNSPDPRYAEMFFVAPLKDYLGLCRTYFRSGKPVYYDGAKTKPGA